MELEQKPPWGINDLKECIIKDVGKKRTSTLITQQTEFLTKKHRTRAQSE